MRKSRVARFVFRSVLIFVTLAGGIQATGTYGQGRDWVSSSDGEALHIPVVCHTVGANNTFFVSDVRIFNPGTEVVTADLFLSPSGKTSRAHEVLVIDAGQVIRLSDVVLSTFNLLSTVGALEIRPSGGTLMATSRTYNTVATGTYGQMIAARPGSAAVGAGAVLHLLHLSKSALYRSNIGFCEVDGSEVKVRVTMLDEQGRGLGTRRYDLAGYGFHQVNDIFAELWVNARENVRVTIEVDSGLGRIFGYASVVDNRSSDQIYVPAQAAWASGDALYVAAASSVSGAFDSFWRTDLRVANVAQASRTIRLSILPSDQRNATAASDASATSVTADLAAGALLAYDDVLGNLFGYTGNAALMIETSPVGQGGLIATARNYSEQSDGSFGQFIPALPAEQALTSGRATVLQVDGSDQYRANVGFLNTSAAEGAVTLELYSSGGVLLASKQYALLPFSPSQINSLFTAFGVPARENARIDFTVSGGGAVFGYLSVIDNISNDPVCVIADSWTTAADGRPDLTPTVPAGWSAAIVVSTTTGDHTDDTPGGGQPAYIDVALVNQGSAATGSFSAQLSVDGSVAQTWSVSDLGSLSTWTRSDLQLTLAAGVHTLALVADSANSVDEEDETNNRISRTITWQNPSLPDLAPVTPAGWSGPIVISTTVGTHTTNTPVGGRPVYVDVALENSGSAATGSFTVQLTSDGTIARSWNLTNLAAGATWTNVDSSLTLASGTHTLRLIADSAGQVTEESETNNSASRTATWTSSSSTIYHGNVDSKIFHKPGCRYYNCGACTAVFYSREAAIAAGYRPCQVCNP